MSNVADQIAITALFARTMLTLIRGWAVVPTIVLFVLLAIPHPSWCGLFCLVKRVGRVGLEPTT